MKRISNTIWVLGFLSGRELMKKYLVTLVSVLFITGNALATTTAQWEMEDGSGLNVADSIGSNDGTLSGGVSWNGFGSGLPGGGSDSLHFDGTGQITIADDAALNFGTGSFTISMDVRGTASGGVYYLCNKGDFIRYELYFALGDFFMEYDAADGGVNDGKTDLQFDESFILTGEWVHIDAVVNRAGGGEFGTMEFYVDGVLVDKEFMVSGSSFDNADDLLIANGEYLDGFPGDIDNIVLRDTAFQPTVVSAQKLTIQSATFNAEHSGRIISKTYDDSGMSGDSGSALAFTDDTHDTDVVNTMGVVQPGNDIAFLEYDLGQSFALTDLVIWNSNEAGGTWHAQGMKEVVITVREQGGAATEVFSGDVPIAPAAGDGPTAASLEVDLTGQTARYIRFDSAAPPNHSHLFDFMGASNPDVVLSEVRVYGDPTGLGNTSTMQACCFIDGTCQQMEVADCTNAGGTPQGPGSECLSTVCPQVAEACCFNDGTCQDIDPIVCSGQGGVAQGAASTCGTTACPQPEACCFNDGTCQDLLTTDCTTQVGVPGGFFSACATFVCPQLEACCLTDGTCQDLLTTLCAGISGVSQGADTTCSFVDCVAATLGTATNVVANNIDDFVGVTYNMQRATSLNPDDWADADPSFHVGDGGTATLVSGRGDPNAFYRYGSDAALIAVGNPSSENGWDTTSEVSARASSQTSHPRPVIGLINGAGMAANGSEHEFNPPTHLMWMTTQAQGAERFAATNDGVWVEFNLGSAQDVSDMLIWNYAESAPGGWTQQGMKDCQIFYTTVGGGASLPLPVTDQSAGWGSDDFNDWTQVGGAGNLITLNKAGTLSSPGHIGVTDTFGINDTAQYVVILGADSATDANYTGGSNADVGLSEVRFVKTVQPPPPAIQATSIGDQDCFSFATVSNTVYELQRALVPGIPIGNPAPANNCSTESAVSIVEHSGEAGSREAITAINGAGITGLDCASHTSGNPTVPPNMWLARNTGGAPPGPNGVVQNPGQTPGSHYVTYALDTPRVLTASWIWNWGEPNQTLLGWKNLEIQVSSNNGTNASDWATVFTGTVPQSAGAGTDYGPDIVIDLGGAAANYVALINTGFGAESNHGDPANMNDAGLAEVRFFEPNLSADPSGAIFENTGVRTTGDGGTQVLYDPDGVDTNSYLYRVVPK